MSDQLGPTRATLRQCIAELDEAKAQAADRSLTKAARDVAREAVIAKSLEVDRIATNLACQLAMRHTRDALRTFRSSAGALAFAAQAHQRAVSIRAAPQGLALMMSGIDPEYLAEIAPSASRGAGADLDALIARLKKDPTAEL